MSSEAMGMDAAIDRGLEGAIACSSAISAIDGTTLLYRGYTIGGNRTRHRVENHMELQLLSDLLPAPDSQSGSG